MMREWATRIISYVGIDNLIQAISLIISFIIGFCGLIGNALVQRRNNSINVITTKRVDRRDKTQSIVADILHLSDVNYLKYQKGKTDIDIISLLSKKVSELRVLYTYTCGLDKKMCEEAELIESSVCSFLNTRRDEDEKSLNNSRTEFMKTVDIYLQTDWMRIKRETVGKKNSVDSHNTFDNEYDINKSKYEKNNR